MRARWKLLRLLALVVGAASCRVSGPAAPERAQLVTVGEGWARSSVNAVIFRGYSLVTHEASQFIAWYDSAGRMLLGKRRLGAGQWEIRPTAFTGNVRDAHNAISIAVDGEGVLHVAWDHHGQPLNYAHGVAPGSLELTGRLPVTGRQEDQVTYPQFTLLPDGGLLLLYRQGGSGRGDVLLDRYDVASRSWRAVAHALIAGQGQRNAYPNPLVVDGRGGWHLSWVWRETPDVASNHDLLYAYSPDEGGSWRTTAQREYQLPITAATAEVAVAVPQGRGLINQTSLAVDRSGRPMIATYWRSAGSSVPQYRLARYTGREWLVTTIGERHQPFRLEGEGTRRIPLSRPLVLAGESEAVYVVFRDDERGPGIFMACSTDREREHWRIAQLDTGEVGAWEPTHDPVAWARLHRLQLFHQRVGQGQGETLEELSPQPVSVLDWRPACPP